MKNKNLTLFEGKKIRRIFDEEKEIWYFSLIDIIGVLTEKDDITKARKYWNKLSERLRNEGSEVVTNCHQLKMIAQDGKMRKTDVADIETILRLIQSVPSKKAEPIKMWLAKVGNERMQEITDPEKSIDRARENWQKLGRSEKWITGRMSGQETRNKLTDYWSENGIEKGMEFAILTNIIHSEWSGLSVKEHKNLKNLKTQNLRDHMTEAELIFTSLAELSTRQIAETTNAKGMKENKLSAKKGGNIAKNARKELEEKTGKSFISGESFLKEGLKKETMKTFIKSRYGDNICVVVEKAKNQKGLAFLMHGFGGGKDEKLIRKCSEIFRENNFTVVSFDARNTFGESEGNYEKGTITNYYSDLEDVIFWASNENFYEEKFYLSGHSLGGICTTLFTQNFPKKVKALIPISPVVSGKLSMESMNEKDLLALKKVGHIIKESSSVPGRIKKVNYSHFEDRLKYNLLEKADEMDLPILIIVGENDETTPVIHQKILFEKLNCKKDLKIIKNSQHSFKKNGELEEIGNIINDFIKNNN